MLAVAEHYEIESEYLPRSATGFCSGLSRTAGTCGALNGGILAIGLIRGRQAPGAPVDDCYKAVQDFVTQFEETFTSSNCAVLTGCHLGTPEGQAAFRENQVIEKCLGFVETATKVVLDVLDE